MIDTLSNPAIDVHALLHDLPVPWKPTYRVPSREAFKEAKRTPSLKRLPIGLVRSPGQDLKPPILHYGWVYRMYSLLEYADNHGLIVRHGLEEDSDCVSDSDEDEGRGGDKPKARHGDKYNDPDIDFQVTMNAALAHIAATRDLQFPAEMLQACLAVKEDRDACVVSVCTNYTLKHMPSQDMIKQFGEALTANLGTAAGEPMWHLDYMKWHWWTLPHF